MCCIASDRARTVIAAVVLLLLSACGSLSMELPSEFLRLESPRDTLRATTPDDLRLWVRSFGDPDCADLSFWQAALHHDLTQRGYATLGDAEPVSDGANRLGSCRSYAVTVDSEQRGYLVAVFVLAPGTVRTVEFVAPRSRFDAVRASILAAIPTLRD